MHRTFAFCHTAIWMGFIWVWSFGPSNAEARPIATCSPQSDMVQKLEAFVATSPPNFEGLSGSVDEWFSCADSLLHAWRPVFSQRPKADTFLYHLYPLVEAHFGREHPDLVPWQVYYGEAFALKRKHPVVDTLLNQVWHQFSQDNIRLTQEQIFLLYAALAIRRAHSAAYEEGIRYTELAIAIADSTPSLDSHLFPIVLNTLGSIYFHKNDYEPAIAMFRRAIQEIGTKPEYEGMRLGMRINLASSLMENESLEEAEKLFAEITSQ
ncbi:MAG: tetratricopeptide repeat protein, partial [Bacteroidota bacterium]